MEAVVFVILAGLVVGLVLYVLIDHVDAKNKQLVHAKAAYQASLAALTKEPTSPDLKQRTLALGRAYAGLTRDRKSATIFDEVALLNDIGAACAAATRQPPSPSPSSVEARMAKLDELHADSLVTDEEYRVQRTRILQEL
jgi:hypothetical protein